MLFLHISSELRLEVSLNDYSGSRTKIKLVCEPSKSALEYAKEHKILWKGSKFGMRERNKLRERLPGSIFVPEINVNSPEHYHCFLLSPKSSDEDYNGSKKRFEREVEDFVPAQFGSCSPGYRIDQDKCYPCPPGSYTSGQDSSCSLCPKDFYMEKKAADSCFPCPDGKKTIIEGADSEDLCVYIDTSGRPLETPSTKLLVLGICAALFIMTAWILITIYLLWWFKKGKRPVDKMERGTLTRSSPGGTLTQSSAEDHIYAEIGENQDATAPTNDDSIYTELIPSEEYEKPRSASQDTIYTEILPTESDYEEPIKGNKDNTYTEILPNESDYEEPIKGSDDHIYTEILPSESDYEEPRKGSKDNIYTEILPSESDYEEPRKGSKDNIYTEVIPSEHEYETIQEPEESNESQESPSVSRSSQSQAPRPRTSKDYYETPITKQSSDSAYPVFVTKGYPRSLEKTTSSGFQPWLPSVEKPKEKVEKSEYEELAEIILKTSKSETNYQDSNKLPDLEEMGYDVETLSELIKALSKRSKSSDKSKDDKDTTKNQNVSDRRHNSESLPKALKKSSSAKEKSINTIRNKNPNKP